MNKIVFYCKSYNRDVLRVKVLLESVLKYNKDDIHFYISCPREDLTTFKNSLGTQGYTLICDEDIFSEKMAQGWLNQQIIKSSFWKLGVCDNYLLLDSDSYFIRPFYIKDFISPCGTPYTVMHEQKELFSWACNKTDQLGFDPYKSFGECRQKIMDIFGRNGKYYDFGPVPVIWNSDNWKSLEEQYLKPNGITIVDAINSVPSEFTWYGEWLLTRSTKILPIEPIFKVFHYPHQYHEYKQLGYTESHLSKVYMGIVMQSNANVPIKY